MTTNKRNIRTLALQTLFMWDAHGKRDDTMALDSARDSAADDTERRAAIEMATAVWNERETIDPWVERVAPQWPPRRQPGVDRNLIRLAVWELIHADTPPKVVIDEAIELAKLFSTENSPSFVNGVLDAVLKEHKAVTGRKLLAGG